ncbi:MAG TPA: DNA mismatch repair protein MutS [Anaeromyxobacteraceae bacterium]|nr:DNA mismatch repair protein MutS [Anaeromyxobacteraceae bacterium]
MEAMARGASYDPRTLIGERLSERRLSASRLERRDRRIALLRLVVFLIFLGLAVAAYAHRLPAAWLALPGAAYLALVRAHDRALKALGRARRAVAFHEGGLLRLEGRFAGKGDPGHRYASDEHPYARDLDLFGEGSLFELLCTARTLPGADALARWLLAPAAPAEVRARQGAVAALAPRLDLREDLAVLGEDVRAEVQAERLARWAAGRRELPGWLYLPALGLPLLALSALAALLLGVASPAPLVGALLLEWGLLRAARGRLARVLGGVERPGAELAVLAGLLARLEQEPFDDPRLRALRAKLGTGAHAASRRIAALSRTVERAAWAQNQLFAPIAFLLLWRLHAALAIERWRAAHGGLVREWLAASADFEALAALAAHAFLHPEDPFPEIDEQAAALYEGEGLGHPLISPGRCVRNAVRLGPSARLLIVSGSNMSGKSTLLRTVGANAVLALCGAPVRATRLRLSALALGATLRIQDSLAEGRSRFWSEITRLRKLKDQCARESPLLFLLDELLAGTNSRDRRIGAEAVVRAFLAHGAVGILTTHDLALSELAVSLPGSNAHFEDEVRGAELRFDYTLRPGVATNSNALALMRAVGLEVG